MKIWLTALLTGAIAGGVTGAVVTSVLNRHHTDRLTTRQLIIVDQDGRERAQIGVSAGKEVSLDLFDPHQRQRLSLGVKEDTDSDHSATTSSRRDTQQWVPTIELDDQSGRTSAILTTTDRGNSILEFIGSDNYRHVALGYMDDDSDVTPRGNIWGLGVARGDLVNSIGLYDYKTSDGEEYIAPALDGFGSISVNKKNVKQ